MASQTHEIRPEAAATAAADPTCKPAGKSELTAEMEPFDSVCQRPV